MEHFDDIEINDSANTIAESVYTALREHLPPMLPHREQDLVRQVADAVYLKLRPIYKNADEIMQKEVEATEEFREKCREYEDKLKPFESRISDIADILHEQSEELAKISDKFKANKKLKNSIRKLSA